MVNLVDGTAGVFYNIKCVCLTVKYPERRLSKKHTSIKYYCICEVVTAGCMRLNFIPGSTNLANLLSNIL